MTYPVAAVRGRITTPANTFTPESISGLQQWIEARLETGLADNAAVDTLTDQSGNGYSGTSAGSARATYKTAIINGLAVYRFDGADDYYNCGDILDALNTVTWFQVFCYNDAGFFMNWSRSGGDVGTTGNEFRRAFGDDDRVEFVSDIGGSIQSISSNTFDSLEFRIVAGASNAATGVAHYLEETPNGTGSWSPTGTVAARSAERFLIGARRVSSIQFPLNGDLAAHILYNRVLTAEERGLVVNYLQEIYSL